MIRRIGLIMGPVLAVVVYGLVPLTFLDSSGAEVELGHAGRGVAALAVWMACWWMSEAIPVYATALLPVAVLPLLQARSLQDVTRPYADKLIFLFLGGFILALAMQRSGLHKRVALATLKRFGTRPPLIVAGFMLTTAAFSMWVSNTATAMLMLPIAISLIALMDDSPDHSQTQPSSCSGDHPFALCLLLGIAYAASIGGLGTLIGSPPNGLAASFLQQQGYAEIGFLRWMKFGVPLVVILLPLTWFLLVQFHFRLPWQPLPGGQQVLDERLKQLGPVSFAEKAVLITFLVTACLWVFRPLLAQIAFLAGLTDSGIAITSGLVLFLLPAGKSSDDGGPIMNWESTKELPWGLLILFGGGLSLAASMSDTGLSQLIGNSVTQLRAFDTWMIILAVIALIIFLTEITSNTATVAAMLPVLYSVAIQLEVSPMSLIIPATLAGSCAFMLPVATPPNAVVFGSGRIAIGQMARAGFWLNLICLGVLLAYSQWMAFGVE